MHAHNFVDLGGKRFGRLYVLSYFGKNKSKHPTWLCKCDCGTESVKIGYNLKSGATVSCGCRMVDHGGRNLIDLTERRFGRLHVKCRVLRRRHSADWSCLCDCGVLVTVRSSHLISGKTKSCGCLRSEVLKSAHTTHGNSGMGKFEMWRQAKRRARRAEVPFEITVDDIPEIPNVCPVLGISLERGVGCGTDNSPSLDRVVPYLGYIKGNICIISRRANTIKSSGSIEDHIKIINYIRNNSMEVIAN